MTTNPFHTLAAEFAALRREIDELKKQVAALTHLRIGRLGRMEPGPEAAAQNRDSGRMEGVEKIVCGKVAKVRKKIQF